MKNLLAILLLSQFLTGDEYDLDKIELLDKSAYLNLIDEIISTGKPIKDPWMKENEYQKLLNDFILNYQAETKFFKIDLGKIYVPCFEIATVCYDVESEHIKFRIGEQYNEFEKVIDSSSNVSEYDGQTVLQKNFDKKTSVTKMVSFEDKLVFSDAKGLRLSISVPVNEIKNQIETFKPFIIFKVDLLDDHQLDYQRDSYIEPTISYPFEFVTNAKKIYASIVDVIIEKNGEFYISPNPTYIPKFAVAPIFPRKAQKQSLNGYVITNFTIQEDGSVSNVKVLESFCSKEKLKYGEFVNKFECDLFDKSAIEGSRLLTYNKQKKDIDNVTHKFTYVLE